MSSFGDVDKNKKTFAEKVLVILQERNIKYTVLAREVGENVSTIKQIFYGRRKPKREVAHKICDYLKIDYFSSIKDDPYLSPLNEEAMTFGSKLSRILSSKNITQAEFAESIGISTATLSLIINDKQSFTTDVLFKICDELNLNVYDLIKDDPRYMDFANNFVNQTTIGSLFRKVGLQNPTKEDEEILVNLINDNKTLFSSNKEIKNTTDVFSNIDTNNITNL